MNKNNIFDCKGNDNADQLLCMLESNSVLSENFSRKISNIVLTILSNLKTNEKWVEDSIKKLKEEMDWINIFSSEFKHNLINQLELTILKQKTLNK
jgi:hypothetical protein